MFNKLYKQQAIYNARYISIILPIDYKKNLHYTAELVHVRSSFKTIGCLIIYKYNNVIAKQIGKYEVLAQCCLNVVTPSATATQHSANVDSTTRVFCDDFWFFQVTHDFISR